MKLSDFNKVKKYFFLIVALFIFLLSLNLIPSSKLSNSDNLFQMLKSINNCGISMIELPLFESEKILIFKQNDVYVFPEIKNLRCVGKVKYIEKVDQFKFIIIFFTNPILTKIVNSTSIILVVLLPMFSKNILLVNFIFLLILFEVKLLFYPDYYFAEIYRTHLMYLTITNFYFLSNNFNLNKMFSFLNEI